MANDKVTSQDVAKRAGVSQSAVSRVFTPGASASKTTIEKVKKAADELGYRPNVLARSLITGKSRIIGLVVAYLENHFYPDALEKLSKALQQRGYHVLIFMASNNSENIDEVVEEILDYQVAGIVAASVALSSELAGRCQAAGIPVVLFNRSQDDDRLSAVTSDNFAGGRKVAEYLIDQGHTRLGYIAGWEGASTQRDREMGFKSGVDARLKSGYDRAVGNYTQEGARAATIELFSHPRRPTAVFVANDHMAFIVMDVIRHELGLRVPQDVAVIGYDDVPMASWPSYDLTTVRQPANRMVVETVNILMNTLKHGATEPKRVAIDGPLVVRGSSKLNKDD